MRSSFPGADFLIDSFDPGYLESASLGYSRLSAINPGLVMVSITAFGQDGPYAHYKATDVTGMALGGFMHLTGDPDRAPLRPSFPHFYLHGSAAAATAANAGPHSSGSHGRGAVCRRFMPAGGGADAGPRAPDSGISRARSCSGWASTGRLPAITGSASTGPAPMVMSITCFRVAALPPAPVPSSSGWTRTVSMWRNSRHSNGRLWATAASPQR